VIIASLESASVHVIMDFVKESRNLSGNLGPLNLLLLSSVTSYQTNLLLFGILLAQLKSDWNTFKFPVVELPSRVVVFTIIKCSTNTCLLKDFGQLLALAIDGRDIVIFIGNWNEYDLNLGNSRWKYKSLVITVDHDH